MPITLTPEQEAWLQAHVLTGDFTSIEQAVRQLLDERIAERSAEERRKRDRREALRAGDLSDEDLRAIAETKMNPRHNRLDDELR
jgi:Arc/MetJ-type ribon-helix-helix transcriptional regulator